MQRREQAQQLWSSFKLHLYLVMIPTLHFKHSLPCPAESKRQCTKAAVLNSSPREQWTPCGAQWTPCGAQWTPCGEQWTLCREQWTLCREQWTLCREHVNPNTVHARSALLTSWLSESGVLTKRDMQNMQSGGDEDWNWETQQRMQSLSAKEDSCNAINTRLNINARLGQVDFVKGQVKELPDQTSNQIKTNNQGSTETLVTDSDFIIFSVNGD